MKKIYANEDTVEQVKKYIDYMNQDDLRLIYCPIPDKKQFIVNYKDYGIYYDDELNKFYAIKKEPINNVNVEDEDNVYSINLFIFSFLIICLIIVIICYSLSLAQ